MHTRHLLVGSTRNPPSKQSKNTPKSPRTSCHAHSKKAPNKTCYTELHRQPADTWRLLEWVILAVS